MRMEHSQSLLSACGDGADRGGAAGAALTVALRGEVLDGHMYPACAPFPCPYPHLPAAKGKGVAGGGGRRPREPGCVPGSCTAESAPLFPGPGQLKAAAYLDSYQRAQLMALLSQGIAGLSPLPRRASSRDVAVQVNPRCDASVQCSLGRRTLPPKTRDPGSPGGSDSGSACRKGPGQGHPPNGTRRSVRFPRSVALYSPFTSRRVPALLKRTAAAEGAWRPGAPDGQPSPPRNPDAGRRGGSARKEPQSQERGSPAAVPANCERPVDAPGLQPQEAEGDVATPRGAPTSPEPPPTQGKDEEASGEETEPRNLEPGPRLRFQFLEQKYGFYHCKDCNIRWESAYVWCVQGTNKVYFKQLCRNCQKSYNPYRVEDITCQSCKKMICSCSIRVRHTDPKRSHRQDLCGRCKGKRLSCDSTFSFKYIV
ncbi:zygote arrest protein 1 [Sorex araneus]|uniref:zygote arrest protein 1 n=1 Tax=Sorex araneus TaxID=42254 RepID=UPI002433D578|nr:zygote arrest protein 1 [Sorex araneus]